MALIMAIPMVGIYLPMYDTLLNIAHKHNVGSYAPFLSGIVARTVAVFCTAPFELARTRLQAMNPSSLSTHESTAVSPHHGVLQSGTTPMNTTATTKSTSTRASVTTTVSSMQRVSTMWTGVGATLARDVPFSGLYWAFVETLRPMLLPFDGPRSELDVFRANVAAGGISGALAGAITTPLDVIKTRTQLSVSKNPSSMMSMMRSIATKEGAGGLFQGWSARAAKAAPACAIVLSAYEMLKYMPSVKGTTTW